MKVAALDLGSNTFLCLIAEVTTQKITKIYADEVEIVRLGQGLNQGGAFHPEALARADKCLDKMKQLILQHQPTHILAMATAAARKATNQQALLDLGVKYQIPIEIIPGEQEAQITYQGAISGLQSEQQSRLIIDIGGGSTEFIFGRGQQLLTARSFNFGCVNLTEKYILQQPTPQKQITEVTNLIREQIQHMKSLQPESFIIEEILAVAGTPTTLAAATLGKFDPVVIDGFKLTLHFLNEWLQKLQAATVEEKIQMGIPAGRADVILIGVIILIETLHIFNLNQITVSTRGVRYGIALEMGRRYQHLSN